MNLYITADRIGIQSGGGIVTAQELLALQELGDLVEVVTIDHSLPPKDPFSQDQEILAKVRSICSKNGPPRLMHAYAGSLTATVSFLKSIGTVVTYTTAAHDKDESKEEHERLGIGFPYPHLVEEELWQRYTGGYILSDVLIVPSQMSARVKRKYGRTGPIAIIPHGCFLPEITKPYPKRFTTGYLGAIGPDKGLAHLFQAWREFADLDSVLLIAGSHSTSDYCKNLLERYGGGNVSLLGWQNSVSDFYNSLSVYIQFSVSEGFGIEVLEAMAHGRPVICSRGAGAADIVPDEFLVNPRDIKDLVRKLIEIKKAFQEGKYGQHSIDMWKKRASQYTWDDIRNRYKILWKKLLG